SPNATPTSALRLLHLLCRPTCQRKPAVDTSSEITTKDLKEKTEVVEEAENGRDAPAYGNANEENGEQEDDNEVDEEEKERKVMARKRMEMKMRRLRQLRANGQLKMTRMMMLILRSRRPMRMTRQQ
ncbi:Hypothetical predicted protein, partial [Marmota monax]